MITEYDGYKVYHTQEKKTRRWRVYIVIEGKRVYLHRYIANKYMKPIGFNDLVHHKDGDPLNNIVDNLEIVTRAEHIRIHKPVLGYKFTEEQKVKLSKSHKGQKAWNKGKKGFKHSKQSKANMSKAQQGRVITWGDKISKAKIKLNKEEILSHLKRNPKANLKDIMVNFNLKSKSPIQRLGGLKQLKKEIKYE